MVKVDSLSLFPFLDLVPLCRKSGITGTQTALTWLEPNTASDVKRPNISRALMLRQWKSVTCLAVCVPVHTTYDNKLFPILTECASCHRQLVSCAPSHCQQYTELQSFRVPARVRPLVLGREGFPDHDIDATITSCSLPWSLRCHFLPIFLFQPWTEHHRPRSCPNAQEKKRNIDGWLNARRQPPAGKAREANGPSKPVYHGRAVKISAWSKRCHFCQRHRMRGGVLDNDIAE